jgi:hypothetical protein
MYRPEGTHRDSVWCPVVEFRRYALHRGAREQLIDLFDREFIESQEAVGLIVMGQFRDLDDPDSFAWLRGFHSMEERGRGLAAFYDGPVWQQFWDQANATMIDSDNVLLIRPARAASAFGEVERPDDRLAHERAKQGPVVLATVYYLVEPAEDAFLAFFESTLAPRLRDGITPIDAYYITDPAQNNFPRLPVREGEWVLISFAIFETTVDCERSLGDIRALYRREPALWEHAATFLTSPTEIVRMSPTLRSRLPAGASLERSAGA